MNIQQYYQTLASIFLNGSLAAFVPVFFIILFASFLIPGKSLLLLAAPFLLLSFLSYQSYMINRERSEKSVVGKRQESEESLLEMDQYLLTFLPAPSLRLLFFSAAGHVQYEICDIRNEKIRWFLPYFLDRLLPAEYGIYTHEQKKLHTIRWKRQKAEILDEEGRLLFTVENLGENLFLLSTTTSQQIHMKIDTLLTDIHFTTSRSELLGRIRKGWMPREWGKSFQDANTPVMTFADSLSEEMKLALLALIIHFYRYRNH